MIAPVNDNRHMISHDANMICGHLNKLQAYMNVGGKFHPLLQVEYVYSRTKHSILTVRGHQANLNSNNFDKPYRRVKSKAWSIFTFTMP